MKSPDLPSTDRADSNVPLQAEIPVASLRQFLIPDQPVLVNMFVAENIEELKKLINTWVTETANLVVVVGPVSVVSGAFVVAVTYVAAVVTQP